MDESGVCLGVEVSAVVLRASAEFECQTEPVLVGRDAGCHTDITGPMMERMLREGKEAQQDLEKIRLSENVLQNDEKLLKFYTGKQKCIVQ